MELVCPAGNLPSLKAAIDNGADAVYIGFKDDTNARHFAGLNLQKVNSRHKFLIKQATIHRAGHDDDAGLLLRIEFAIASKAGPVRATMPGDASSLSPDNLRILARPSEMYPLTVEVRTPIFFAISLVSRSSTYLKRRA